MRPEKTISKSLDFDARFFQNKLHLDMTFIRQTPLISFSIPLCLVPTGVASVFQNGADFENRGIESVLWAIVFSTSDFSWDINLNFSKNESEVLRIIKGFDILTLGSGSEFMTAYRTKVGRPFGEVYSRGFEKCKVYGKAVLDNNGNSKVVVGANDVPKVTSSLDTPVANNNPDFLSSIQNNVRYKNWSLNFLIDVRQGVQGVILHMLFLAGNGLLDYTALGRSSGILVFGKDIFSNLTAVNESGETNTIDTYAQTLWSLL